MQENFQGGHLSSNGGGALFFREVEGRRGLIEKFSHCFEDRRDQKLIKHPVADLLSQCHRAQFIRNSFAKNRR